MPYHFHSPETRSRQQATTDRGMGRRFSLPQIGGPGRQLPPPIPSSSRMSVDVDPLMFYASSTQNRGSLYEMQVDMSTAASSSLRSSTSTSSEASSSSCPPILPSSHDILSSIPLERWQIYSANSPTTPSPLAGFECSSNRRASFPFDTHSVSPPAAGVSSALSHSSIPAVSLFPRPVHPQSSAWSFSGGSCGT